MTIYISKDGQNIYRTFSDGSLIKNMEITGPYIMIRLYLDGFGTNNPIGSSRDDHKILGVYYTPFVSLEIGSKRSTIQTGKNSITP